MKVPGTQNGSNVVSLRQQPSLTDTLMAAAVMHGLGRFGNNPALKGTDMLPEKLGPEEDLGLRGQEMEIKNKR